MRKFEITTGAISKVPLLVGLYGPSGCGKTLSAIRLAKGMGGKTIVLDTESKRALHYKRPPYSFDFQHVDFQPPFNPQEYADALQFCVEQGAQNIVVDSGSHMHEGVGGMLEMHAAELARMGGKDSMNFTAWIKPKRELSKFVQTLLRFQCNFVFCFRAKEKLRIQRGKEPLNLGWMPIMPEELPYEMTINALMLPGACGVPTWSSDMPGEGVMVKLPGWAREIVASGKPFDEDMGARLAAWAAGDTPKVANVFSSGFRKELAGKPLEGQPIETVSEYVDYLKERLEWARKEKQGKAEFGIKSALDAAQEFYDATVAAAMDAARKEP